MMRVGGLCAGYGGLEMGLAQVLDCEPVWFCEFADGPSKILAHRYPGVPNHHDLTATDWATVEPVDIVTAGFPCQPFSTAGARKGADDERAIWPAIAGAIRVLRPRIVALENVPGIITAGELARVLDSLAAIGYDTQWVCVRASDVGAPHRRERIFIVAHSSDVGHERGGSARGRWPGPADGNGILATNPERGGRERRRTLQLAGTPGHAAGNGADAPDTTSDGRHEGRPESAGIVGGFDAAECGARDAAADTTRSARRGPKREHLAARPDPTAEPRECTRAGSDSRDATTDWGPYRPAIQRWEHVTGRPAPAPTEPGPRGGQRLSPLLVEFMMGLPAGWVTDVPGLSRNEQLKALGNGVVPQQATAAFTHLLQIAEVAA